MSEPLLEVEDLTIQYRTKNGMLTAVSDASFTIDRGEYFGLVGESGCGKSTMAKAVLGGLDDNGEVTSGKIRYKGEEIQDYSEQELNEKLRWREVSYVPQGSMDSLDPLAPISDQAWDIAQVHTEMNREEAIEQFRRMFEVVGLQESRIDDYPHEFSGGMQQRAIIAISLFLEPSLLVADEPTTALDVIMQDQIFKYLDEIREETETSMLLITHDISVILESCDEMAIMHSGQVAETGSTVDIYDSPRHPYSILLQEAFPDHRRPDKELGVIEGYPPQTTGEVDFCTFVDRCPWAVEDCWKGAPPLEPVADSRTDGSTDHMAACIRRDEVHELYDEERSFGAADVEGATND
jgi:oligopeptide/dipeptide ABC transporter ATP-binding protein